MSALNFSSRGFRMLYKFKVHTAKMSGFFNLRFPMIHNLFYNSTNGFNLGFQPVGSRFLDKVHFSSEAAQVKPEDATEDKPRSTFQQLMHLRLKQARCSVLIELSKKGDIPFVTSACEKFGAINNLYTYSGESNNVFLLMEFVDESSIKELLSQCGNENISDAFSITSRILCFKNNFKEDTPKLTMSVEEEVTHVLNKSKAQSISELIEDTYLSEKLSELNTRLRFFFCGILKDSLYGLFPHCEVYPFGSSVNGMGKQGCDLDIVIRLYPPPSQNNHNSGFSFLNKTCVGNARELQKKSVFALADYFATFLPGFSYVRKILHARVPILKFKHKILRVECDISVNNLSPVLMSEMLYFCGEIDSRVRPLLYAVKKWAKEANVTYETPGSWITNFGLSLLVVFFLQNRPFPILPHLNDAVNIIGTECSENFELEYLVPLSDLQAKASLNKESLAELLNEFLTFLGTHPFQDKYISVLDGMATKKKAEFPIWIQYPLEEDKNVTKNVSVNELYDMCEKARLSSKYLSANLHLKDGLSKELSLLLGIPNILRLYTNKSKKLDVGSLLMDGPTKYMRKGNNKRNAF